MSTRNLLEWVKGGRPTSKADNFTATCEPIVYTVWQRRRRPPQSVTGIALIYLCYLFNQFILKLSFDQGIKYLNFEPDAVIISIRK
jgi:hypothetical protein